MLGTRYALTGETTLPLADAVARVREELKVEGFGVLTEIDVKATMKEKLDADFRDYVIIGACNPPLAYRALQADLSIGLLLPCNVVVYAEDSDNGGGSVVAMFDPQVGMAVAGVEGIEPVAREARERLQRALAAL